MIPFTATGLSVGLPPNQGVLSLPHPSRFVLPAMELILAVSNARGTRKSGAGLAGARESADVRRTKNPYSGARIGPFSRSAARNEKLPAEVHKVTIVRATSSRWLVNGCTRRHLAVPRYRTRAAKPRRAAPLPTER